MPTSITVKSVLNKTRRRDPWFLDDYTINPYSGCSFNCLYCYIRGSKYGTHMEEKLAIKANAIEVLHRQLKARARKKQYGFIVLSSATDPYLQFERDERLTRQILEVILAYRFPVHIITKSDLVIRDLDLLKRIANEAILPPDLEQVLAHKVFITFSFSTLDEAVANIFEPGATPPLVRLETLKHCLREDFFSGVSMMPMLPYITDTGDNLETMVRTFKQAGTKYLFPGTLTLFGEGKADSRTLVFRAVEKYYPHLIGKYGKLYSKGSYLPYYYQSAFNSKLRELQAKCDLPAKII